MISFPNPTSGTNTLRYSVDMASKVKIVLYDMNGRLIRQLVEKTVDTGTYNMQWSTEGLAKGSYIISAMKNGNLKQSIKVIVN